MSEAIWIELIKVLPAFLWIGFGFIALAIAKRIFTQQAPRMTRVETPWVTVELAQQAIEQAAARGTLPRADGRWSAYPDPRTAPAHAPPGAVPSQAAAIDAAATMTGNPWGTTAPSADASTADEAESWPAEDDEPFPTHPPADSEPKPLATPPADAPADNGAERREPELQAPVTAPRQSPPPRVTGIAPPPGGNGYYVPPANQHVYASSLPANQTGYAATAPLPPYAMPSAYRRPPSADSQRGLRAATRLALSADLLQGGAILWVDDHQEWNEPLIRLFRTAGITVDAVVSTARAMLALKERHYDLVITDTRRNNESKGDTAGVNLLDQMIAAGVPTPAVFFSDHPGAVSHPRAVTATNSPETLVDTVVDIVGTRRSQQSAQAGTTWLDRLKGT